MLLSTNVGVVFAFCCNPTLGEQICRLWSCSSIVSIADNAVRVRCAAQAARLVDGRSVKKMRGLRCRENYFSARDAHPTPPLVTMKEGIENSTSKEASKLGGAAQHHQVHACRSGCHTNETRPQRKEEREREEKNEKNRKGHSPRPTRSRRHELAWPLAPRPGVDDGERGDPRPNSPRQLSEIRANGPTGPCRAPTRDFHALVHVVVPVRG